jgi:DNA-binding MarR family transcriptional regulator
MTVVTPLARGALSYTEQMVLGAVAVTSSTAMWIAAATGLDEQAVEAALAELTRRGLVIRLGGRAHLAARRTTASRKPRRSSPSGDQQPTSPAA